LVILLAVLRYFKLCQDHAILLASYQFFYE